MTDTKYHLVINKTYQTGLLAGITVEAGIVFNSLTDAQRKEAEMIDGPLVRRDLIGDSYTVTDLYIVEHTDGDKYPLGTINYGRA